MPTAAPCSMSRTTRTIAVKICGLTTPETMNAALEAGADYVGLVFFPKSPRNVTMEAARRLAEQARGRAQVVALVVDEADDQIKAIIEGVRPDWLQLHGHETIDRVRAVRSRFGLPVMKALSLAEPDDVTAAEPFRAVADLLLFDAKPPKGAALPGGNGLTFEWRLVEGVGKRYPFMLSGGLTPKNVASAIAATGTAGVDVSSGVESLPGVKDPELIGSFIRAAKAATVAA